MELDIKCIRCGGPITHICNKDLVEAAKRAFSVRIQFPEAVLDTNPDLDPESIFCLPEVPFLSETYLYALLGKEDGRTVLAVVNNILRAAGLDPHEIARAAEQEAFAAWRERRHLALASVMYLLDQPDDPLVEGEDENWTRQSGQPLYRNAHREWTYIQPTHVQGLIYWNILEFVPDEDDPTKARLTEHGRTVLTEFRADRATAKAKTE